MKADGGKTQTKQHAVLRRKREKRSKAKSCHVERECANYIYNVQQKTYQCAGHVKSRRKANKLAYLWDASLSQYMQLYYFAMSHV